MNAIGTVVGYGASEENIFEQTPKFASMETVSQEECYKNHQIFSSIITSNTFCAGGKGSGPCRGDSGGSFLIKDEKVKQWTVVGVVSKGVLSERGCNADNFVVFMKVFVEEVLEWILEIVKDGEKFFGGFF
jgi:secreted trypsin-like serine protease